MVTHSVAYPICGSPACSITERPAWLGGGSSVDDGYILWVTGSRDSYLTAAGNVASSGDEVAKLLDRSVNDHDLDNLAASSPVRTANGIWCNGVYGAIQTTAVAFGDAIMMPVDIYVTARFPSITPLVETVVFDAGTGSFKMYVATDGEVKFNAGATWSTGYSVPDGGWHTYHIRFAPLSTTLKVDGTLVATGNAGDNTLDGFTLGANAALALSPGTQTLRTRASDDVVTRNGDTPIIRGVALVEIGEVVVYGKAAYQYVLDRSSDTVITRGSDVAVLRLGV